MAEKYSHNYRVVDTKNDEFQRLLKESNEFDQKHRYKLLIATEDDVRKVKAEGAGLYEFTPGKVASFKVNTSKAGKPLYITSGLLKRFFSNFCINGRVCLWEHNSELKLGKKKIMGAWKIGTRDIYAKKLIATRDIYAQKI